MSTLNCYNLPSFLIWSLNVECLTVPKLGELCHLMSLNNPHIVLIQETWLKPDSHTDNDISITGYSVFRKDRLWQEHGGVLAYVKDGLCVSILEENINTADFEVLWLRFHAGSNDLFIANVYRCPSSDSSVFNALASDVEYFQATNSNSKILIVGDLNCHHSSWLGSKDCNGLGKSNDAGISCYELCLTVGLENLVSGNTYLRNSGQAVSVLDLVLTDSPLLVKNLTLENPIGCSPHCVVSFSFDMVSKVQKSYSKISWKYHRADWDGFCDYLQQCDWLVGDDVNLGWEKVKTNITSGMEKFIPKKVIKRNVSDKPWFTDKCAIACSKKKKAWYIYKKLPTAESKAAYLRHKFDAEDIYANAQTSYSKNVSKKLEEAASDPKAWWQVINHICGKGGHVSIPTLTQNGKRFESASEKAEILKEIFASKSTIDDSNKTAPPCDSLPAKSLNLIKFRVKVIYSKLIHLKESKATGPDGIPAKVLRKCARVLSPHLSKLFTMSFRRGIVPNEWKCANVVPIFKSGKKSDPDNYRPISLLPIISKVMESIVNDQLRQHLFGLNLISKHQFGFRPKHFTFDMLTHCTQSWENALDKGQEAVVVSLDISRAFDSVWHSGLLSKLMSAGIGSYLYRWIHDFLRDRSIKVVVNGSSSSAASVNAGVPQGSILGPTLFLIFINDLNNVVKSNVCMFADDTTIFQTVPNVSARCSVIEKLNKDLENLEDWSQKWLMKFNAKKTQFMIVSRKADKSFPPIKFFNESLSQVDSIKLVGVNISSKLDWNEHVNKISKRAGQMLGIMRKSRKLLPPCALSIIYKTRVRSAMEYCGPIWENASNECLKRLDTIQSKALRLIGNGNGSEFNIHSLEIRRNVSALSQFHRMVFGLAPEGLSDLLPSFKIPSRDTRNVIQHHHFQLNQRRSRSEHHRKSFIPKYSHLWNNVPISCMFNAKDGNVLGLQKFKEHINKWLICSKR